MKATCALLVVVCIACADGFERTVEELEAPPTDPAALERWMENGHHRAWAAWSEVGQTLGSGGARVFLSDSLFESLSNRNSQHPTGASAVRELYAEDWTTRTGYSVLIKVAEPSVAASWFCFERLNLEPGADRHLAARGAPGCTGCHSEGTDFIRSTLPLP